MTPPSVNKEAEQKWEKESGVEVGSVNVENTASFETTSWSFPESS
jgi:hypothetical protein